MRTVELFAGLGVMNITRECSSLFVRLFRKRSLWRGLICELLGIYKTEAVATGSDDLETGLESLPRSTLIHREFVQGIHCLCSFQRTRRLYEED